MYVYLQIMCACVVHGYACMYIYIFNNYLCVFVGNLMLSATQFRGVELEGN